MFRRSAHAQKLSRERNFAQLRNTYHSIRLDELNQNLPSAHRLVEISTRYRRFTSAHAQLRNSRPISSEYIHTYIQKFILTRWPRQLRADFHEGRKFRKKTYYTDRRFKIEQRKNNYYQDIIR